jgi:hypothetical protein
MKGIRQDRRRSPIHPIAALRSAKWIFPSNQQGLQALVDRPTTEPLRDVAEAPERHASGRLGTPYAYKYPAVRSKREFDLYSFGPDRKDGTSTTSGIVRRHLAMISCVTRSCGPDGCASRGARP